MACAAAAALALVPASGPSAEPPARLIVAILPTGIGPEQLAIEGVSPGVMSAGLAEVPATQTYLDIGAGNRVFTSLYGPELPPLVPFANEVPGWDEVARRADSAPAEIVPGLLASSLREGGVPALADTGIGSPALIVADRQGQLERAAPPGCLMRRCRGLAVVLATPRALPGLVASLRGDDLLIAFERPPPARRELLAIGIAGRGFDGNLTSETTRAPGYVLATDLAPTALERFGLAVPAEMSGSAIRSEGDADADAVSGRADRMAEIAPRRAPVIYQSLLAWALVALLVAALTRGLARDAVFAILGLSVAYLPALLLAGAALEPAEVLGERLLVLLGAPALAAATFARLRGWAALAVACGVTLGVYAIDMVAGSPLTALSLLGPNPALGVRFFGIGNELEATLAVLVPVGVGAGLAALAAAGRAPTRRSAMAAFGVVGLLSALVFAAGRFGADVGAAIVFPAGAAAAAVAVPGVARSRRLLVTLATAPLIGLAALFAIDLALGGGAHLSRSVLDAGGAGELADVAERRLRLSASSFGRGLGTSLFWVCAAGVALAIWQRRRVVAWLAAAPLARAGLIGAASAVLLGILANDSASTFFTLGTIMLGAGVSFAFSQRARSGRAARAGIRA